MAWCRSLSLFSQATPLDWGLMVLAAIFAILHGTVLPVAMFVFGLLTNAFVNQYSSVQLANLEVTFDPIDYIEQGRFTNVDASIILKGFINFTNITGGVVNCSESYELLPFNQSFNDILKVGITQLATCLDNPTFLRLVTQYTSIFVAMAVAMWLLGAAHVTLFRVAGGRQTTRLRSFLFSSVVWQELGWFDGTPPGQLTSRLTQDVDHVEEGLGEKLGLLIQWMATLVAAVIVSLVIEWRLTLLMAFAGLLIAMSTALLSVVTSLSTTHTLSLSAAASNIAEEALAAIATVKAFCAESEEVQRYTSALRKVKRRGQCVGVVTGLCLGTVQLLVFGCYASSFWLGAYLVQEELIQAGQFVAVFFAILLVGVSVGQALPHIQRLVAAETAARTLQVIVHRVPLINAYPNEGVWPEGGPEPSVEFHNVSFAYPTRPGLQVLKGVNLTIQAGQTVAVVGATGSGKTTLGHLLTRLYDVTDGQVLVGGYNVSSLLTNRLRSMVGVVTQDHALFNTTIAENIQYGSVGVVSQEDIEQAARQAHAHDFISQLPHGYNTVVGSRGSQLSGGQKQRIAIARALVRKPKIILLDEATSALDTESEKMVQEALDKAREGRTTIIIAHRLSTVCHADSIIVMEGGTIVEMGPHDQLLKKEGVYYSLVHAQLPETKLQGNLSSPSPAVNSPAVRPSSSSESVKELNEGEQVEWNRNTDNVPWFRVLHLSRAEWPLLVIGVTAAALQGAIFPSFSIFFGQAIKAFTYPFNEVVGRTHKWAGLFLALGAVSAVATVFKLAAFRLAGEKLTYRLQSKALRGILGHSISWFDTRSPSPSGLAAILASDTPLVQGVIMSLSSLTEVGVGLLVAMVIAMVSSWALALVVMAFVPPLVVAGLVQVWLLGRTGSGKPSPSSQVSLECVQHIETVQLFGLQETFIKRHMQALVGLFSVRLKKTLVVAVAYGFANFIILVAYAVTFRFAAYLLTLPVDHTLYTNFDEVFTVFIAIILGSLAAGQASTALPQAKLALTAAGKVLGVMATQPDDENSEGRSLENLKGALGMSCVSFSFPARPEIRALSDISLSVAPGQCLALVGPSGAGKSTVLSLLERLYVPQTGTLLVDNIDIASTGLQWWRRELAWVAQDTVLFNRSIRENIAYGCHSDVDQVQIEAAAIAANIHSFILSLPLGYNTVVGSRGSQLSGGQKQCIAIARALVRKPKILLLDEATSALDTESEKMVQEALDKAREGRTTIIIAHRLSTVASADHIAVLQATGSVLEVVSATITPRQLADSLFSHPTT